MELSLNRLKPIATVGRYVWCAAVTNIFIAGLVYTASLAGAQVNAITALKEFKQGIIEGAELTAQERRDHAVTKR